MSKSNPFPILLATGASGRLRAIAGFFSAVVAGTFLVSCGQVNIFPEHRPRAAAFVTVNLGVIGVDTLKLAKAGVTRGPAPLKNLVVTFTSEGDTLRDTLDDYSTPAIDTRSTRPQTLTKRYRLFTDRNWKVIAVTRDINDSIIHVDSTALPFFRDGDTLRVSLNMASRYSTYEIGVPNLPDSVYDGNGVKRALCTQRLVLKVDGVIVLDTSAAPGCFAAPLNMAYNYIPLGTRSIELLAYGALDGVSKDTPLFAGNTSLVATNEGGSSTTLTMNWAGPGTGTASILVTISKAFTIILGERALTNVFN
jgi:hypothetical protein